MSTAPGSALRPRDKFGLSAHYFFTYGALGFVFAFLPLFLRSRGLSLVQIGTLQAVYALAGAGMQIPIGMMSDHLRRRKPLIIASGLLLGGSYLFYSHVHSFWGFLPLYFFGGIFTFTSNTLTSALVSDWSAEGGSTAADFGRTRIWGSIGFIATLAVVSVFPQIVNGLNIVPVAALLHGLSGLSISTVTEPGQHAQVRRPVLSAVPSLIRNTNLLVFLVLFFIYRVCESGSSYWLSLLIKDLHGSNALIARALAFGALVETPFMLWVGLASDRIGRRPPLAMAFLAMPLRLYLYSHLVHPENVMWIQLLHGFTFSFMLVGSVAFVADSCPDGFRATGQGLLNMISGGASALGPYLGGVISAQTSLGSMFGSLSLISLISGVVFILLVHESSRGFVPVAQASPSGLSRIARPVVGLLSRPALRIVPSDQTE